MQEWRVSDKDMLTAAEWEPIDDVIRRACWRWRSMSERERERQVFELLSLALAYHRGLRLRRPPTGVSRALWARVSPGVSDGVSLKIGVSDGVSGGGCPEGPSGPALRSVPKVSRECPRSVQDTFLTLHGH